MSVYTVTNPASALATVEFSPVAEGNFAFFNVKEPGQKEEVKQWLTKDLGQEIVAETIVGGNAMLITHGDKSKQDIIKALNDRGDKLELHIEKKPFNFWALRGGMSVVGQSMQLVSALTGVDALKSGNPRLNPENAHFNPKLKEGMFVRKPFAADIGMFAILNLIANGANIAYGGQQEKGENRMRHIKDMVNNNLADNLAVGDTPIGLGDSRATLRKDEQAPPTVGEKINDFAKENSVRFFEIGLRFIGATALVIPLKKANLKTGMALLSKGQIAEAWNAAKNPNKLTLMSGLGYLTGKTLALFTKTPDPYEDKPHTWVDTVREKWLFRGGGLIEAAAGAGIAYNAFNNKKVGFSNPNTPDIKPHTDWLGTIGGGLFAAGYIVRMFAKFGEKHVDMNEVYAHADDTLAKTPPDKLPQLLADTAASLKDHFSDKPIAYNEIFTKMMNDMYKAHHIALDNLGTEPDEREIKWQCLDKVPPPAQDQDTVPGKYTAANPPRRPADRIPAAAASFTDKVAQSPDSNLAPQTISL